MKRSIILFTISLLATALSAQIANDALIFGQQYHGGTARYMAMGGAFNALGGDFSTLSVNPAGIGVYRSSEFTATADLQFARTATSFDPSATFGSTLDITDTKSNFNMNNLGYVVNPGISVDGLISFNFAFGFNKLKNYSKAYRAEAWNSTRSLTDNWAQDLAANGVNGVNTGAFLADYTFLVNTQRNLNDVDDYFDDEILSASSPLLSTATTDYIKDVVEKGSINEWLFSVGGNYEHILYFGATVGIQDIDMTKDIYQTEYFMNNTTPAHADSGFAYSRFKSDGSGTDYSATNADYFNYYTQEVTSGIGLNAKFGVIFRPISALRFGFAVHTPTVNYLSVNHYGEMLNNTWYYDDNDVEKAANSAYEDPDAYEYRTISPYKLHASAAMTFGKHLALDVEVDRVDYSSMKIKSNGGRSYEFANTNSNIEQMYKVAYNSRVGLEFKPVPSFAFRGGVAYYGSPYERNIAYDSNNSPIDAADYVGDRIDYSVGVGFRSGDVFMDFAYINTQQSGRTMVFDSAISPYEYDEMNLDSDYNRYMLTLGFKF